MLEGAVSDQSGLQSPHQSLLEKTSCISSCLEVMQAMSDLAV